MSYIESAEMIKKLKEQKYPPDLHQKETVHVITAKQMRTSYDVSSMQKDAPKKITSPRNDEIIEVKKTSSKTPTANFKAPPTIINSNAAKDEEVGDFLSSLSSGSAISSSQFSSSNGNY